MLPYIAGFVLPKPLSGNCHSTVIRLRLVPMVNIRILQVF
nr:MAG TPA: hypothetical protein [Caudoviricetes sp.]